MRTKLRNFTMGQKVSITYYQAKHLKWKAYNDEIIKFFYEKYQLKT